MSDKSQNEANFPRGDCYLRYSLLLTPPQAGYLKWVFHFRHIPRSAYLRDLILADMQRNEAYQRQKQTT